MQKKIKAYFQRTKWEYCSILVLLVIITVSLTCLYQLWNLDITVPVAYAGGDDMSLLENAKAMTEQGWNLTANRLGAPGIAEFYDFASSALHNADLCIVKFFALFTNSVGIIANLTYFSLFYLAALISYFVMREMQLRNWIAVGGSAVYALSTYVFIRNIGHFVLTNCYFVPLSVLLCVWLSLRDDFFCLGKGFFKNPRNLLALFFTVLIANNGIAYYPFFTCFMLLLAGVAKAIKKGSLRYLGRAMVLAASTAFFVVMALMPVILHTLRYGSNAAAVERAGFTEAEIYGLKIIQLFIPVNSHGNALIGKIIYYFNDYAINVNENISSYLGLCGMVGFLILLLVLFSRKEGRIMDQLHCLAELNIGLVLLGVVDGFGTIFAFLISAELRGYNRISIFILYVSILGFCLVLQGVYQRYGWKWLIPVFAVFVAITINDQFPDGYQFDYAETQAKYRSDDAFVKQIEASVPAGSMIYQLPYHEYPEGNTLNMMGDYDLLAGYLHSDTLRWSYGGMKGTQQDAWNSNTSRLPVDQMIAELKDKGFAGIYIDRRAYVILPETEDDVEYDEDGEPITRYEQGLQDLEDQLAQQLGTTGIRSDNDNLEFFAFPS